MENLFIKWRTKTPKYDVVFEEPLFKGMSKKGGGSEKSRMDFGKHFSNNYELYIYAYFLGLYKNEFVPILPTAKKTDFNHAIQHWGSKGNRLSRKDFTQLQEYIFMSLVAKSKVDFIALDKGEIKEEDVVNELISVMESYTNGGLILIKEKLEENSNYFLQNTSLLNMISLAKGGNVEI